MKSLAHRVMMMIGRGTVSAVDDSTQAQELQIELLADEVHDRVERAEDYGLSSVPLPGAEVVTVSVHGLRSHQIAIRVIDRRHRPKAMQPGEVTMHDDQGQIVMLKRDGIMIKTPFKVTVEAPQVIVTSDDINLGEMGGKKVARVGDHVVGGVITEGSDKVKAA